MAIDTEEKRKMIMAVPNVWYPITIIADTSFNVTDRRAIAWTYSGIIEERQMAAVNVLGTTGGMIGAIQV
jgi:hypothetical protein